MKTTTIFKILVLFISNSYFAQTYLPPITWTNNLVKDNQQSAGFIDVADFDNDGKMEIVLSTLMEEGGAQSPWSARGAIRIFEMTPSGAMGGLWNETIILPTSENLPFINDPQIIDVDEDGFLDIVVNQGFIQTNGGSQQWIKGPAFTQRFDFTTESSLGNSYYFWHEVVQLDFDGDGKKDIITTSAQTQDASNNNNGSIDPKKAKIEWYRHLGNGNFEYHLINDSLGGVFLKLNDIDDDGDQDIVVSQFFWGVDRPALVWLENISNPSLQNNYQGDWNYHIIDNTTGLGYYMKFYDIDIDGEEELVYVNHNNEDNSSIDYGSGLVMPGLFYFEIPANPASVSQWPKTTIYDGFRTSLFDFGNPSSQGCPGIFSIGDVDGNGYPDIAVPGDGNDTLYLFRQIPGNSFVKEVLDIGKMFGMTKIVDLDNDGTTEVVAAKHNFPEFFQLLFPPAGFLKIYKPSLNCQQTLVDISPSNPILCPNENIQLSATNNLYYVWNNYEITQDINVSSPGEYIVIATNSNGCPSSDTVDVILSTTISPIISENAGTLSSTISGESYQWYFNGTPINNSNSQTITVSQDGEYKVEVFFGNCSEISDIYNYEFLSIENQQSFKFNIFPNPSKGLINVSGVKLNEVSIEIQNAVGEIIKYYTVESDKVINLNSLANGVYFLKINGITKRIVISK